MNKHALLIIVVIAVLLALTGAVSGARPQIGPFTTEGDTTVLQFEPLTDSLFPSQFKFHLMAQGGADGFFDGAFTFEEWGIVDFGSGYGANHGLMTITTDDGEADFRFDGQTNSVDVWGTFAVLDGSSGFKGLRGEGWFRGNADYVFTVYYEPCGGHSGTACPAGQCFAHGGDLTMKKQEVRWQLTNYGDERITIDSVTFFWPVDNGPLTGVTLGKKIYEGALNPSWATLDTGWAGADKSRQINQGQTKELQFEFTNVVSTDPSGYTILVQFAEGCAATAVAFTNP